MAIASYTRKRGPNGKRVIISCELRPTHIINCKEMLVHTGQRENMTFVFIEANNETLL